MRNTVSWLHLSDLHVRAPRPGFELDAVFLLLRQDVKHVTQEHGIEPDFLFFTGDAVWGFEPNYPDWPPPVQYRTVHRKIQQIAKDVGIDARDVFVVPGNHDVHRPSITWQEQAWLEDARCPEDISRILADYPRGAPHEFMRRLAHYDTFLRVGHPGLLDPTGRCFCWKCTTSRSGLALGIAALNTAWAATGGSRDRGRLWLGMAQVEQAKAALTDADLRVVLTHHPMSWVRREDAKVCAPEIYRHFQFHLHGHEHYNWVTELFSAPHLHMQISAGAGYVEKEETDREHFRHFGYNLTRFDADRGLAEVFLRQFDHTGGGWVLQPVYRKAECGTWLTASRYWQLPPANAHGPTGRRRSRSGTSLLPRSQAGSVAWGPAQGQRDWMTIRCAELSGLAVTTSYDSSEVDLPEPCLRRYRLTKRRSAQARKQGRDDAPTNRKRFCLRAIAFGVSRRPATLALHFGPSDYFRYLSTAKILQWGSEDREPKTRDQLQMREEARILRARYLSRVRARPQRAVPFLANSFGLNILVVTLDNMALLVQRSRYKDIPVDGLFHVSVNVGLQRVEGDEGLPPDLFREAKRGVDDELGCELEEFDLRWTSLGLDPESYQYGLVGYMRVPLTIQEVVSPALRNRKLEISRLSPVEFSLPTLRDFIRTQSRTYAWSAIAMECIYQALLSDAFLQGTSVGGVRRAFAPFWRA